MLYLIELKLFCLLKIFPQGCTEFPKFSMFIEIPEYSRFSRFVVTLHTFCRGPKLVTVTAWVVGPPRVWNRLQVSLYWTIICASGVRYGTHLFDQRLWHIVNFYVLDTIYTFSYLLAYTNTHTHTVHNVKIHTTHKHTHSWADRIKKRQTDRQTDRHTPTTRWLPDC